MKVKAQGHDGEAGELAGPTSYGGGDLDGGVGGHVTFIRRGVP